MDKCTCLGADNSRVIAQLGDKAHWQARRMDKLTTAKPSQGTAPSAPGQADPSNLDRALDRARLQRDHDDGQREDERLAAAGEGDADHVPARQPDRQALRQRGWREMES